MHTFSVATYVESLEDLDTGLTPHLKDVLLSPKELGRLGTLDLEQTQALVHKAQGKGLRPVLEWDILMTENVLDSSAQIFRRYIDQTGIQVVRLQDPGALEWVLENYPELKIQWVMETGNHNLEAMIQWVDYIGEQLDRVVLSLELPREVLKEYIKALKVPVELLVLGRILLFYTPRTLLSFAAFSEPKERLEYYRQHNSLEAKGNSEESPHKGFPLIENRHGTFMFNTKDHFLLENLHELEVMGMKWIRLDLRHLKDPSLYAPLAQLLLDFSLEKAQAFRGLYPREVIRGFYSVNKTDVLFPKLKNLRLLPQDETYLGQVVDVVRPKFVALQLKNPKRPLKVGDKIKFLHPEGKVIEGEVKLLQDASLNPVPLAQNEDMVLINYLKGVVVKSALYHLPI